MWENEGDRNGGLLTFLGVRNSAPKVRQVGLVVNAWDLWKRGKDLIDKKSFYETQ